MDLVGFTTSLSVQRRDLALGVRLAWEEFDANRQAFRYPLLPTVVIWLQYLL